MSDKTNYKNEWDIFSQYKFSKNKSVKRIHRISKELVQSEFVSLDQQHQFLDKKLGVLVRNAYRDVPYYRDLFEEDLVAGFNLEKFTELPILNRATLVAEEKRLESTAPYFKTQSRVISSTSGTSGPPAKVHIHLPAAQWFSILWLRQARWFRNDLSKRYARLRLPQQLRKKKSGETLAMGESMITPCWQVIGRIVKTGDEVQFSSQNDHKAILNWLEKSQPSYFMSFPGLLEELALSNNLKPLVPSIESYLGVSSLMTQPMRTCLESAFQVPVHENYGLNEIGLVAARCSFGRYHIHLEHAYVEVVDDEGEILPPGIPGRLLVTGHNNALMPLIRYDTGDIASLSKGPCPCGITLPAFENLAGRYHRYSQTPEGTRSRVNGMLKAMTSIPHEMLGGLKQYQFHQKKGKKFMLYLNIDTDPSEELLRILNEAWVKLNPENDVWSFEIKKVEKVHRAINGKVMDFYSDYYPESQRAQASPQDR